jgi:hypothetical protein
MDVELKGETCILETILHTLCVIEGCGLSYAKTADHASV